MASIIARGRRLYAKIKGLDGEWYRLRTSFVKGQEALAEAWANEREAEVEQLRTGSAPIADDASLTAWVKLWGQKRRELGLDGNNDVARLEKHVLTRIGKMAVESIEPKHLVEVIHEIRTTPIKTPRGMEPPAPRTVYNVYSALCATFRDARLAGRISVSPCCLTEYQLGAKVDSTPGWRNGAVFDRAEAQTLISSSLIPWDRRVAYAIELLAGLRPGENAAIRWSHYDTTKKPLGGLFVGASLNSKRGVEKRTKTDTEKWIPVHPTLAVILAEWKLHGWTEMMGRQPRPDDLIVPLPPADAAARTKRHESEPFRTTYYSGRRWHDDLAALEWRGRRHYDMRATFVTLMLDDGADVDIIERRITHTKKSRSAIDGYNRGKQWAITCAELVKLQIHRVSDEDQQSIAAASTADHGPTVVQADFLAAMSATSGLRRRASNPLRVVRDEVGYESDPAVAPDSTPPTITDEHGLDQSVVQRTKSACDLGLALMRAAAVVPAR